MPKHKNKSYLTILYDRCETLRKNFNDAEIGEIIRALIAYELDGEPPQIEDRALSVICATLCDDCDFMTTKANQKSKTNQANAIKGWQTRKEREQAEAERYLEETMEMYKDR